MTLKTLLSTAALIALPLSALADAPKAFDVAEDITRLIFAAAPVFDDGMPAYGNAFVTQGYIYPAGTLSDGAEGVNPDGSPAYPDLVIGTWTCDGYFVGDGMRTETGAIVIARQVHRFDTGEILVSHGPEIVDAGVPFQRAVTGGTGNLTDTRALQQVMLGMSEGYGVRLQFALDGEDFAFNGN